MKIATPISDSSGRALAWVSGDIRGDFFANLPGDFEQATFHEGGGGQSASSPGDGLP
jgi:hypothetical protein